MAIQSVAGPYGRLGGDARQSHMQHPMVFGDRVQYTGTAARSVQLGVVPAYAMFTGAYFEVTTAFAGSSPAPVMVVGTYGPTGAVDDADELVDSNDVDLTSAGYTSVTDKLGLLFTEPRILLATFSATNAVTAGEVVFNIVFSPVPNATNAKVLAG